MPGAGARLTVGKLRASPSGADTTPPTTTPPATARRGPNGARKLLRYAKCMPASVGVKWYSVSAWERAGGVQAREALVPRASGTAGAALHSAPLAMNRPSCEYVVKAAVALGHDTDTTACVAGGLAGIRHGVHAIPRRWMKVMRGKDLVEPLLEGLKAHLRRGS